VKPSNLTYLHLTYKKGKEPTKRCRWVDNIKVDLREIGWSGVDWIGVAQDRGNGELL
jgi:hypothetical protein